MADNSEKKHERADDKPGQETLWFVTSPDETAQKLGSSLTNGLSDSDAGKRLSEHGKNELQGGGGVSAVRILMAQIFNGMVLVLIIALAVSLGIQSWIESGVIGFVVLANVFVGFIQEYSSAKTMDSLRSLASPSAVVIRGGETKTIPAPEVTIGDLVVLKTGDVVPADLRLIEAVNFEADEALLTGESLPVQKEIDGGWDPKDPSFDPFEIGVGDRITMAYTSSTVTKGRATGLVVAIGMTTEIGAIAQSLRGGDSKVRKVVRDEEGHAPAWRYAQAALYTVGDLVGAFLGVNKGTPLQRRLSQLAVLLFFVAVLFAIIVFSANRWVTTNEVILYAVATGLSMVPASLVVVLTITLAGGTRAMVRRNVIVRELNSLEALGAVTDICSDKTGTLTQGKMVCRAAWVPSRGTITVGQNNEPFNPTIGDLSFSELEPTAKNKKADKSSEGKPDKAQDKHHDDGAESSSSATRTDENEEQQEKKATTGSKNESTMSYQDIVKDRPEIERFLDAASLCNLATVVAPKDNDDEVEEGEEKQKGWSARGDPTECAIQVFAHRFDWGREKKTQGDEAPWSKQLYEFPFDSDVKRMSVIYASKSEKEKKYVFTKGAVERLLEACTSILNKPGEEPETLDDAGKERVLANVEALAEQGLRVLALATKPWDGSTEDPKRDEVEKDLTLLGLVGLYDPPRPETKGAVAKCHTAGIHVHMLTGDHAATARAIALEVGILPRNIHQFPKNVVDSMVMTAAQFDKLSDEQVDELPVLPLVIARCAPQTKVRMVDALHRRKAFCAMTGDGVNDSPSLKRADVGIAMGMNGSDVAKDASDIVLSDDNFASILAAIEEGRRMFDNIQKFLLQLLAENIAQAFTLLIGLAFKDPQGISVFPLAPVEILWIIMITSGFPAMGLGMQKASSDIMTRPPHSIKTGAFTTEIIVDMFVYGIMSGIIPLMGFIIRVYGFGGGDLGTDSNNTRDGSEVVYQARATAFALLTWLALILALEVIDLRRSFFRSVPKTQYPWTQWFRDIWGNQMLFWSVNAGIFTIFPLIYIPVINDYVFKHAPITWEWAIIFIGTIIYILYCELWKWVKRIYRRRQAKKAAEAHGGDAHLATNDIFKSYIASPTQTSPA